MDGDSSEPDANTSFTNLIKSYFGVSAYEHTQVCLFVSFFKERKCLI